MNITFPEVTGPVQLGNYHFRIKRNIFSTEMRGTNLEGLYMKGIIHDDEGNYPALFYISNDALYDVLAVNASRPEEVIAFAENNSGLFKRCACLHIQKNGIGPTFIADTYRKNTNVYDMSETLVDEAKVG